MKVRAILRSHAQAGILCFSLLLLLSGCGSDQTPARPVRIATTTSTANSGLLDYLLPHFTEATGVEVEYVATGTGKALAHGRNGDVDVVLVHAPSAEEAFVADGFGVARVPIMWNDFVIAGPASDPAQIADAPSAVAALQRIAENESPFISRGDDSGTHKKERALWQQACLDPYCQWYIDAGQGMGACLVMAHEKLGYVLTDRGTYLAMASQLELEVVYEGDPILRNPYAMIAVAPEKYPDLNHEGAKRLIDWMITPAAQTLIADFKVGGKQLFYLFEE